jgi:hypothetical protein
VAKLNQLEHSVERKVRGDAKKEVSWPISIIVTEEHLTDKAFMEKYPNAKLGSEICDPVPPYLKRGEKRSSDTVLDQIRDELRKEQIKQQVVQDHFNFDAMTPEEKRKFFEEESDFELPDDHSSILTAYEQAGIVVNMVPEVPTNPNTPLNQTENPPKEPDVSGREEPSTSNSDGDAAPPSSP